jgi:RNA polymerase sigma factor (sigma-70 family)
MFKEGETCSMELRRQDMVPVLRAMCEGSAEAFELFYDRYAPLVMQIALRMLGDRMEAEDLCHDVFMEVLRRGQQYEVARGSLEAWISVLTRSRCLDRMRRGSRVITGSVDTVSCLDRQAASAPNPEETVLRKLERAAVRDALGRLPSEQQRAVVTAYYGAKTQREMAEEWKVPLGTVKSWVRYGLHNLRKQLDRRGWAAESEGGESYGTE